MPAPIPVDGPLIDRILDIETDNFQLRLNAYAARPGNPAGIHIRRFGGATAFCAEGIPVRLFNSVFAVEEGTRAHLPEIERFYASHRSEGALEIAPGRLSESFGRELAERGYAMVEFHAALHRPLEPEDRDLPLNSRYRIEAVDPRDDADFEAFLDLYVEGWQADPDSKANLRTWRRNAERWSFYRLFVDDAPALAGILDVRGETALNGTAGTRPDMRGQGAQAAFIRFRIRESARRGCKLMVAGAYFGTSSMRNHQREGFATSFTRGIWTRA